MSERRRLPNRRQIETHRLVHNGHTFFVSIGYDTDGTPLDCFASTSKTGTEMDHLIADACVIISLVLQYDHAPAELLASLGNVPDLDRGKDAVKPASVLGSILTLIDSADPHFKKLDESLAKS